MLNLQANMAKCFPRFLRVFFFNDINIKICADALLDDFSSNSIVFLILFGLGCSSGLGLQAIYNVPDFFLFKYGWRKVSLLRPIFKAAELFSLASAIIAFDSHYVRGGKEDKKRCYC